MSGVRLIKVLLDKSSYGHWLLNHRIFFVTKRFGNEMFREKGVALNMAHPV